LKFRLILLLAVTWFVDLLWLFYWVPHWQSEEMKNWQRGLHNFVIFASLINWVMKLAVIGMVWTTQKAYIQ
jgi:hypothetical protein